MTTIEELKQTALLIKKNRPSYESILEFYTRVFEAQEDIRKEIDIEPILFDPDLLAVKQQNGMPLIDPSEFVIDTDAAERLLAILCDLAVEFAQNLSSTAETLKTALGNGNLDAQLLFRAILDNQDALVLEISEETGVPEADLALFGYLSMAPGIEACARQLAPYLEGLPETRKEYCPICGSRPDLAHLDEDGKRHVRCSFCHHVWLVRRMGCVFCGSNEKDMQYYFFNDREKEYRVNLCDKCRQYIKVVDLRQMDRSFYPNLEMVSTLHLDMKAREKGYGQGHNPQESSR